MKAIEYDKRKHYLEKVRHDHKSKAIQAYFSWYVFVWYHSLFWMKPEDRRPFTLIMKDWIFPHKIAFTVICIVWFCGLLAWAWWHVYPPMVLGIASGFLISHLVFGEKWIPGEQEDPPYLDYDDYEKINH